MLSVFLNMPDGQRHDLTGTESTSPVLAPIDALTVLTGTTTRSDMPMVGRAGSVMGQHRFEPIQAEVEFYLHADDGETMTEVYDQFRSGWSLVGKGHPVVMEIYSAAEGGPYYYDMWLDRPLPGIPVDASTRTHMPTLVPIVIPTGLARSWQFGDPAFPNATPITRGVVDNRRGTVPVYPTFRAVDPTNLSGWVEAPSGARAQLDIPVGELEVSLDPMVSKFGVLSEPVLPGETGTFAYEDTLAMGYVVQVDDPWSAKGSGVAATPPPPDYQPGEGPGDVESVFRAASYAEAARLSAEASASNVEATEAARVAAEASAESVREGLANYAEKSWVLSRGTNLVSNGTGYLGNNTNFSSGTFDALDRPPGTRGSFVRPGGGMYRSDEIIPINTGNQYVMRYWARQDNSELLSTGHYAGLVCIDDAGNEIASNNYAYRQDTMTTLARPLSVGDTEVHLTSAANWLNNASNSAHILTLWNYVDPFGRVWPEGTYTRDFVSQAWNQGGVNYDTGVITLRAPYSGVPRPAGTPVANGKSGSQYIYMVSNRTIPGEWTQFTGRTDVGLNMTGDASSTRFPPGTAGARVLFLLNYGQGNSRHKVAGIEIEPTTRWSEVQGAPGIQLVDSLPSSPVEGTIYFVRGDS